MRLIAKQGRLAITLRILHQGRDLQVMCSGGQAHIGAVALASPCPQDAANKKKQSELLTLPGHREDLLAAQMARRMANDLNCTVCVSAGIHFDYITKEEIERVFSLVDTLTERCIAKLKQAAKDCSC